MVTNLTSVASLTTDTKRSIHSKGISRLIWEKHLTKKEHSLFFLRMLKETLNSLVEKKYIQFDAQTTSNCCHGLSILVRELILSLQSTQNILVALLQFERELTPTLLNSLPGELIDLASLYILTLIIEIDPIRGRRTTPLKLQSKGNLGTSFCKNIVKNLQKIFSNFVAKNYKNFFSSFSNVIWLGGTTVNDWIKFTYPAYLREDKRGTLYASCMFSMQVSLGYLSQTQATIALVNDLINPHSKQIKGRYVSLLKNVGEGNFSLLNDYSLVSDSEPIIVFGGYVFSETLNLNLLSIKMEPWAHQFASLVLACDIHYPQFPFVSDDPSFDFSPIIPKEKTLSDVVQAHTKINGVSAKKPSLFCLSHVFVTNIEMLMHAKNTSTISCLPPCYSPCPEVSKYLETFQNKR